MVYDIKPKMVERIRFGVGAGLLLAHGGCATLKVNGAFDMGGAGCWSLHGQ